MIRLLQKLVWVLIAMIGLSRITPCIATESVSQSVTYSAVNLFPPPSISEKSSLSVQSSMILYPIAPRKRILWTNKSWRIGLGASLLVASALSVVMGCIGLGLDGSKQDICEVNGDLYLNCHVSTKVMYGIGYGLAGLFLGGGLATLLEKR